MANASPTDLSKDSDPGRVASKPVYTYWPPVQTFVFLLVAALAWYLLNLLVPSEDLAKHEGLDAVSVGSAQWRTWTGAAALGQATAFALLILGCVRLIRVATALGITDPRAVRRHIIAALLFVICVAGAVYVIVHDPRGWSVPPDMGLRLGLVATVGILCATPWVALTWLVHQVTRPYWHHTQQPISTTPEKNKAKIKSLLVVWEHITTIALAFAVFVVVAIIPTGALRNLWLSQQVSKDNPNSKDVDDQLAASFPATDVLLYGALFGLLIGVLVIPLVFSWRTAAQEVVDDYYPRTKATADDPAQSAGRARLEAMLHLDVSLIRNPLTLLSIFTPLVTAGLAAFLPNLAK